MTTTTTTPLIEFGMYVHSARLDRNGTVTHVGRDLAIVMFGEHVAAVPMSDLTVVMPGTRLEATPARGYRGRVLALTLVAGVIVAFAFAVTALALVGAR